MQPTTRREALILIASAAPAAAQTTHQHAAEALPAAAGPYRPSTLTAGEMLLAATLSDLIIPRTDTPGASDAGVPEFIDRRLTASPGLAASFRRGLGLLGPEFSRLTPEKQIAMLKEYSEQTEGSPKERFFRLLKEMTIEGYYSSRAGLTQELGWHGNTFLTEFKGCTHPEHQA
jgi:gluconate 2-dehydrogenase gamma chain